MKSVCLNTQKFYSKFKVTYMLGKPAFIYQYNQNKTSYAKSSFAKRHIADGLHLLPHTDSDQLQKFYSPTSYTSTTTVAVLPWTFRSLFLL